MKLLPKTFWRDMAIIAALATVIYIVESHALTCGTDTECMAQCPASDTTCDGGR